MADPMAMALPYAQGRELDAETLTSFLEMIETSVNHLDDLNKAFPKLATSNTRETVDKIRSFAKELQQTAARHVLSENSLDDTLGVLQREFNIRLNAIQLPEIVGKEAYIEALRREAHEFKANQISPQQTAKLWDELGRIPLGGERWTEEAILALLKPTAADS